ncbi:DNA-binding transcriptional regulator, MarR family [Faunimonas pinastri]|uniref:DNA-binding transcriptional regulator, MarR family n=1 Tax=Faunimonas pinastri TaxID=1855383 RepID=A0A1H9K7U5_9HYPH|nr:MarR family transcriptional regulator [Faunimonas pinastri]SEQ95230.1 DNA-binding transcriptional regulator, MarR family [Faunimonas pinastri]
MNEQSTRRPKNRPRTPSPEIGADTSLLNFAELDGVVGFHLRRAQEASFRAFASSAGEGDLRPGRFAALMLIGNNPGITQISLSRAIGRDKSTLTPLIRDLQARGLIHREQAETDRRAYRLTLTPDGETMLERLRIIAAEHDRKLDEIIGERKTEFITLLRRIVTALGS